MYEDTRQLMPKNRSYRGGEKKKYQHFHVAKDLSHWREFQLNSCHCWQLELQTEQGSSRVLILSPCWPRALTIQLIIFKGAAQSSRPSSCWAHISPFTAFVPASDQDSGRDRDKNHLRKEVWRTAALKSTSDFTMRGEFYKKSSTRLHPAAVLGGNSTPRGEAIGALLALNVSGRFVYIHMHFGRGIAETELVIAAFAPDWLGHLSSSLAAKQHPPLLTLIHTAHKSPGSSSGTGFGTSVTDWSQSAHYKKKLRKPAMKAVICVRDCYRFSSLKTTVNKIQENFL